MEDSKYNRRDQDRYQREITAQYFLKKHSMRYQDCTVADISRTGAKVKLPGYEKPPAGSIILLEIIAAPDGDQINIAGVIKWHVQQGSGTLCGVQFNQRLSANIYAKI